ncbi:hypothetical protein [Hymenobacter metallicola]|uniref:hypothetical protein n=1 Tax=Hymenobacter metallicola TaxID=2563114 RepID=UPI001436888B|nr:hypothetical protein [Hymenobacter metallicola]
MFFSTFPVSRLWLALLLCVSNLTLVQTTLPAATTFSFTGAPPTYTAYTVPVGVTRRPVVAPTQHPATAC